MIKILLNIQRTFDYSKDDIKQSQLSILLNLQNFYMNGNFILESFDQVENLVQKVETLIQWIYRLCEENNLSLKTTELAAQLFQKCFSQKCCNLSNILLIAITSLFISIKYNECSNLTQINLQDCILLGNGNYTEKDFLEMELKILNLINFDVNLLQFLIFFKKKQYNMLIQYYLLHWTQNFGLSQNQIYSKLSQHLLINLRRTKMRQQPTYFILINIRQ